MEHLTLRRMRGFLEGAKPAMNDRMTDSNVYYLPAPAPVEARAPEPVRLLRRLRNAWWRLRLAFAEIRTILRQPQQRLTLDDYVALLDLEEEDRARTRRRRPARPARVIDFEAARLRLRPATRS
jgi:hypothetical protein